MAVFDTALHATLPPEAFHYAVPYVLYRRHRVRRYGFHGTSHAHVAARVGEMAKETGEERGSGRLISIHLGNGASACEVVDGRSVDTSMGFTPLEGPAYAAAMGGVDAIGFTGGIGQNSPEIRARRLRGLEFLGVEVDAERNAELVEGREGMFHRGTVLLAAVRTGEELVIALEAAHLAS